MHFADPRILALLQEDDMGKSKISTGSHRFATLCTVVLSLLSLPNSNADNERVFSMVKQIDTDNRSDLSQETICALLSCKLNTEDSCFYFQPSDELLKSAKSATWPYVKANPSRVSCFCRGLFTVMVYFIVFYLLSTFVDCQH